jgi:hypothetical protein
MAPAERERSQLVVALGEGAEGQRLKDALDQAAQRAGKTTSAWAREILMTAAGVGEALDPVVEATYHEDGHRRTFTFDLRHVAAIQGGESMGGSGQTGAVTLLLGGTWWHVEAADPMAFILRWKRVHRWGVA